MNMNQDELNTALEGLIEEQKAEKARGRDGLKEFMDHVENGTPLGEGTPITEENAKVTNAIVSLLFVITEKHKDLLKSIKGGNKEGLIDKIDCPICSKQVRYSISGYNGHIWGKCETKNALVGCNNPY